MTQEQVFIRAPARPVTQRCHLAGPAHTFSHISALAYLCITSGERAKSCIHLHETLVAGTQMPLESILSENIS